MTSQSKRIADDEDRISKLPDDLVSNILSRLPTSDAVATCVLSKYWKDKWMSIYNIDIDTKKWRFPHNEHKFVKGVEKLFQHVVNVKSIFLKDESVFRYIDWNAFESIVSGFLRCKTEKLHLNLGYNMPYVVIHGRLLSRVTLRKLILSDIDFKVPTEICFPLLKTMRLQYLYMLNETDNTALKFTLPVLEKLEITNCRLPNVKLVEIYAPSLQRLKSEQNCCVLGEDYEIKIVGTTGPVRFASDDEYLDNILFTGSKIISASFPNISDNNYLEKLSTSEEIVGNLLRNCFSTLVDLELSFYMTQIFAKALQSKHGFTRPMFNKLERLVMWGWFWKNPGNTEALFGLLHAAPSLKCLVIKILDGHWYDYDYDAVGSLPSCIFSTLEEINLDLNIKDNESMPQIIRLAKFLMQIGVKAQLKRFSCTMNVGNAKYCKSDELMNLISSFPRAPPHFTLCATASSRRKLFSCGESGWAVKKQGKDNTMLVSTTMADVED